MSAVVHLRVIPKLAFPPYHSLSISSYLSFSLSISPPHSLPLLLSLSAQDVENKMRQRLNEIYFIKTKDIVNSLRLVTGICWHINAMHKPPPPLPSPPFSPYTTHLMIRSVGQIGKRTVKMNAHTLYIVHCTLYIVHVRERAGSETGIQIGSSNKHRHTSMWYIQWSGPVPLF